MENVRSTDGGDRRRARHRRDEDELREIDAWSAAMHEPTEAFDAIGLNEPAGVRESVRSVAELVPSRDLARPAAGTVVALTAVRPATRPRGRTGRARLLVAVAGLVAITTVGAEAWLAVAPRDQPLTGVTANPLPSGQLYPIEAPPSLGAPASSSPGTASPTPSTVPAATAPTGTAPTRTAATTGRTSAAGRPKATPTRSGPPQLPWRRGIITGVGVTCLDIDGGVGMDGNRVQIWACNGTDAQVFTAVPDGTLQVVNYCLRIKNDVAAAGVPVEAWTCDAKDAAQQWRFTGGRLVNPASGLCLTSPNDNTTAGTQVEVAACGPAPGQRWSTPPLL